VRVHHLNCATMRPASRRLVNGTGGLFEPGLLVCHCLLVETEQGLVLIDSGIGSADIRNPVAGLGEQWLRRTRPRLELDETAVRQVSRLGYRPEDVRHVVLTHLHRDHAGGISDFPWATVHVFASEHEAALRPATPRSASGTARVSGHTSQPGRRTPTPASDGSASTRYTSSMGYHPRSCWYRWPGTAPATPGWR